MTKKIREPIFYISLQKNHMIEMILYSITALVLRPKSKSLKSRRL